jgi:hypothetical protein
MQVTPTLALCSPMQYVCSPEATVLYLRLPTCIAFLLLFTPAGDPYAGAVRHHAVRAQPHGHCA